MAPDSILLLRGIPSFALMPNGKNQHGVMLLLVAVQSDVAGPPSRNDQLSHIVFGRVTDQRMMLDNLHGFRDQFDRLQGSNRLRLEEEISKPFKVSERLLRINQPRQDFAFGLEAALPRARART